ncbi:MAG: hypothetical protein O2800_01670 [Planctomycetota bacterium]|nr:hypothetical protein [Planctomycetota bacterium]
MNMHRQGTFLVIDTPRNAGERMFAALMPTEIMSVHASPPSLSDAYRLHRTILEIAPFYLSISPLDVSSLDLSYTFQLETDGNCDEIVAEALLAHSPLLAMLGSSGSSIFDSQPFAAFQIDEASDTSGVLEVRTIDASFETMGESAANRIFVDLTIRRSRGISDVKQLPNLLAKLVEHGERIVEEGLIPHILVPLRERILAD